jgi:hypothetical protein
MKPASRPEGTRVESMSCPVCGREVTCRVSYHDREGKRTLTYFECAMDGLCGIPRWDPCPLYVRCLEGAEAV